MATDALDPTAANHWQPLPVRARFVFMLSHALGFAGAAAMAGVVAGGFLVSLSGSRSLLAAAVLAGLLLGGALGAWLGRTQYRYTSWKLDADGFAVRRGRLWRSETRVPRSRVQHLDLKRGPLERRHRLATLVIHTAGTRQNAVGVSGLDDGDAERLRDHLARQVEQDDDDIF